MCVPLKPYDGIIRVPDAAEAPLMVNATVLLISLFPSMIWHATVQVGSVTEGALLDELGEIGSAVLAVEVVVMDGVQPGGGCVL